MPLELFVLCNGLLRKIHTILNKKCIYYGNSQFRAYEYQIALTGKNFCLAAKEAFENIWANSMRFSLVNGIGAAFLLVFSFTYSYIRLEKLSSRFPQLLFSTSLLLALKLTHWSYIPQSCHALYWKSNLYIDCLHYCLLHFCPLHVHI